MLSSSILQIPLDSEQSVFSLDIDEESPAWPFIKCENINREAFANHIPSCARDSRPLIMAEIPWWDTTRPLCFRGTGAPCDPGRCWLLWHGPWTLVDLHMHPGVRSILVCSLRLTLWRVQVKRINETSWRSVSIPSLWDSKLSKRFCFAKSTKSLSCRAGGRCENRSLKAREALKSLISSRLISLSFVADDNASSSSLHEKVGPRSNLCIWLGRD